MNQSEEGGWEGWRGGGMSVDVQGEGGVHGGCEMRNKAVFEDDSRASIRPYVLKRANEYSVHDLERIRAYHSQVYMYVPHAVGRVLCRYGAVP